MTKTKAQLRAEAVERLRMLDKYGGGSFEYAILGSDKMAWSYMDKRDALIDLLTDDCGPCYSCAKLAELRAENSQLRVKVDKQAEVLDLQQELLDERDVEATTKSSEKDGNDGETSDVDSRDNGWYLRYDGYMTSKSNYLRISGFKAARALDNRQNLVFVKFMGGKEADCRVYAPKLDVCENLHDSSKETQKPRSREADSGNVSDSDGENLHVEQDTREKLEADANGYVMSWWQSDWVDCFDHADNMKRDIMRLLDRQAVITHSIDAWNIERLEKRIAELQAKLDELTEQLESAHAKNRSLKAHIAKMQEGRHGWHVKYPELEKKNAELEAERDGLRAAYDELTAIAAQLCRACGFSMVDASGEVVG